MSTVPIDLKPLAGFCIKSSTLQPAIYTPPTSNAAIPISIGHKIFVNIAWDSNVPAPPVGSEQIIQRAMKGEDVHDLNPDGWYVPIVVSDGRQDKDKAGKPSLVFDCIYNDSVKSRSLTDPEFKIFLIELALQRLEAQTSLVLSRQIGTPNISSKGKLLPRTVSIPSFLAGDTADSRAKATSISGPLIQEITVKTTSSTSSTQQSFNRKMKGILKSTSSQPPSTSSVPKANSSRVTWSWSKAEDRISIAISVPSLVPSVIAHATLDVEPRRFILRIPDLPVLDVNLDLSDAEIVSLASSATSFSLHGASEEARTEPSNTLTLKRQRDLDVDGANAEWNIAKGVLLLTA